MITTSYKEILTQASTVLEELDKKRKESLKLLEILNLDEDQYNKARNKIIEEYKTKIKETLDCIPGYGDARQVAIDLLGARADLYEAEEERKDAEKKRIAAEEEERKAAENVKISTEQLAQKERNYIGEEEYVKNELEKLKGNTNAILNYLKENKYVYIEPNIVNIMGYKGKILHINLPAVGKFEGFKINYFISEDQVTKKDLDENPELEKNLNSIKQVSELLQAMNKFMKELQVKRDRSMNYERDLMIQNIQNNNTGCISGNYLHKLLGLDLGFWLSDKDNTGREIPRAIRYFYNNDCYFSTHSNNGISFNLLRRLSDQV